MRLPLSMAFADNPRSRPVLSGEVQVEGIDLHPTRSGMGQIGWRQFGFQEFDVSEISLSGLLIAFGRGDTSWVGVPIFTTRKFFHTGLLVRDGAGIDAPRDLAGKRVGVREYQQTAALWTRGILRDDFGVDHTDLRWYMERLPHRSHGGVSGFSPPPGIDLTYIPEDSSMTKMLLDGQLDAVLRLNEGTNLLDRSTPLGPGSGVRPLFDVAAESRRYFTEHRMAPINHCVVVRRDVVDRHPWVVVNLYEAFVKAKQIARSALTVDLALLAATGRIEVGDQPLADVDVFPYGVRANRAILETATRYSHEEGLTPRQVPLEEVFYPATLDL